MLKRTLRPQSHPALSLASFFSAMRQERQAVLLCIEFPLQHSLQTQEMGQPVTWGKTSNLRAKIKCSPAGVYLVRGNFAFMYFLASTCHSARVELRGQLAGQHCHLPLCRSSGFELRLSGLSVSISLAPLPLYQAFLKATASENGSVCLA